MIDVAHLLSVVGYAIVVSQPLAYLVFLSRAQGALSAPAYIELRHGINRAMNKRLAPIYLATLGALVLLLVVGRGSSLVLAAAGLALFCLVLDIVVALRANVPINQATDSWSTTEYPADWQDYRARWFAAFRMREIILLVGFVSLLVGTIYR